MLKIKLSLIFILFSFSAKAAILVEENGQPVNQSYIKTSSSGTQFRVDRKIGVAFGGAGEHGLGESLLKLTSNHNGVSSVVLALVIVINLIQLKGAATLAVFAFSLLLKVALPVGPLADQHQAHLANLTQGF